MGQGVFKSAPAMVSSFDGQTVRAFGVGDDDNIWQAYSTDGGATWQGWWPIEHGGVERFSSSKREQVIPVLPLQSVRALAVQVLYWLLSTAIRERDPLGLSSPSAFTLSGGTQSSIEQRNVARSQGKTRVYGQQTIREGMQGLLRGLPKTSYSMTL